MFSKKATKIDEIFTVDLTLYQACYKVWKSGGASYTWGQKSGGRAVKTGAYAPPPCLPLPTCLYVVKFPKEFTYASRNIFTCVVSKYVTILLSMHVAIVSKIFFSNRKDQPFVKIQILTYAYHMALRFYFKRLK